MRLDRLRARGLGKLVGDVDVDLSQVGGPIVAVVGKNGAGKSTFLELFGAALYRRTATRGTLATLARTRDAFLEAEISDGERHIIRHTVDGVTGKGESLVLDDRGKPRLATTLVSDFDAWSRERLQPPSVFYTSIFAAQRSKSKLARPFLDLDEAERKSILLHVLGVEGLEELAKCARAHADAAALRLESVLARIREMGSGSTPLAVAREHLAHAEATLSEANALAQQLRGVLSDARAASAAHEQAAKDSERVERDRQALQDSLAAAALEHSALDQRASDCRETLRREDEIERAVRAIDALRSAETLVRTELGTLKTAHARAAEDALQHRRRAKVARDREVSALAHAAARRRDIEDRLSRVRREREEVVEKLAATEATLDAAATIRDAVARATSLAAAIADAKGHATQSRQRAEQAARDESRAREDGVQAKRRHAAAVERAARARERLLASEDVKRASRDVVTLRDKLATLEASEAQQTEELAALRGVIGDGARSRIGVLRGALEDVAEGTSVPDERARAGLASDDALVATIRSGPEGLAMREAALAELRHELGVCGRTLRDAERMAAREGEMRSAEAEAAQADADAASEHAAIEEAQCAVRVASERRSVADECVSVAKARADELARDLAAVDANARRTEELARAEACRDELALRSRSIEQALAAAESDAAAVPVTGGSDAETARNDAESEARLAEESERTREDLATRTGLVEAALARHAREREALEPVATLAGALATARAVVGDVEAQAARAVCERRRLLEQLGALPPRTTPPPVPDVAAAAREAAAADGALMDAHAALAVARQRATDAEAIERRIGALRAEQRRIEGELADWNVLAEDLGREGLQAMEIDAAGPDFSALCNDLLRSCVGPRWTIAVETVRSSADGKKQLEGCGIRVLDTEEAREADGESLSGGERVLVGEAISLALTMLACRRAGVVAPTLLRDETGAALDSENARAYVAMLRRAAVIVGASRVLFVSHSTDVQDAADARLLVENGTVRLCA